MAFVKNYPKEPLTFGDKIRKKRIDLGLQIAELSNKINVSEDSIINWEKRNIKPQPKNLKKLCEALNFLNTK